MRLLTVVGNRPQFIKSAPLSVALGEAGLQEIVVHTGQHWDPVLSAVFYEELVSPRIAEALAREAGLQTALLSPIEGLSEQQLDDGKDYASVMRDNLVALRLALGCR